MAEALDRQIVLEEDLSVATDMLLAQGFGPIEDVHDERSGWWTGLEVFRGVERVGAIYAVVHDPPEDHVSFYVRGWKELKSFYQDTDDAVSAVAVLVEAVATGRIWPQVLWLEVLSRADQDRVLEEKPYLEPPGYGDMETWGWDRLVGEGYDGMLVDGLAYPVASEVQVAVATLEWTWFEGRAVMSFGTRQEMNAVGVLMLELEGRARVLNALQRAVIEHPEVWQRALQSYQQRNPEALAVFIREYVDLELEIPSREALFKAVMRLRPKAESFPSFVYATVGMAIQGLPEVPTARKLKNRLLS